MIAKTALGPPSAAASSAPSDCVTDSSASKQSVVFSNTRFDSWDLALEKARELVKKNADKPRKGWHRTDISSSAMGDSAYVAAGAPKNSRPETHPTFGVRTRKCAML
jgi:hypothetical protein